MSKSLVLGNGNILISLDNRAQVRDFYFPYVGLENHAGTFYTHKVGVYVEGQFAWLDDESWEIRINYRESTMLSDIQAVNNNLQVKLHFCDVVYNEKNIFVREVTIFNLADHKREVKLYFHQQFRIAESYRGDSAYYEPQNNVIIHYKGGRVFLMNSVCGDKPYQEYSIGNFGIEGKEGTYKDAEDGHLSGNAVEHGLVDSVIGQTVELEKGVEKVVYYWVIAAETIKEAHVLNSYCFDKTPLHLINSTRDFWHAWINLPDFHFGNLDKSIVELFKKSLLIVRTHVDNRGAIIASGDTDILHVGRDAYWYMWPRDGAVIAMALDKIAEAHSAENFIRFCNEVVADEGYFMHRYRADKSLGSSWHPWIRDGKPALPIQEDETALILYAFWKHYEVSKDLEFVEDVYNSLIRKCAEFMISHRDSKTGLPKPSYDLWESQYGISTYTASTVYAALQAAVKFAEVLGKVDQQARFETAANEVQAGIMKYLYDEEEGFFYKMINLDGDKIIVDKTIDASSAYGVFEYGVLPISDHKLKKAIQKTREKLTVQSEVGGIARFENDVYFQSDPTKVGNPWFITTLWMAKYDIALAKDEKELLEAKKVLDWVARYAMPSGILSEQIDPNTGAHLSAGPLSWSHAEYVLTIIHYIEKLEELGICVDCK